MDVGDKFGLGRIGGVRDLLDNRFDNLLPGLLQQQQKDLPPALEIAVKGFLREPREASAISAIDVPSYPRLKYALRAALRIRSGVVFREIFLAAGTTTGRPPK